MASFHPTSFPTRLAVMATGMAVLVTALAMPADNAQVSPRYGPFGSSEPWDSGFPYGANGDGSNGNGNGFAGLFGARLQHAVHYRTVHGILASVAMIVLFPVGSVLVRVMPGRFAIWIHAGFQVLAYLLYIAGAALGIYLVCTVRLPFFAGDGNLLTNSATNYHPIIGLVVLATPFLQPLLGYVHHAQYKRLGRRTVWSHLHLWNGRVGITLGIINGGLGLHLARASHRSKVVYSVVAAVLWTAWVVTAVVSEMRRGRAGSSRVQTTATAKKSRSSVSSNGTARR